MYIYIYISASDTDKYVSLGDQAILKICYHELVITTCAVTEDIKGKAYRKILL